VKGWKERERSRKGSQDCNQTSKKIDSALKKISGKGGLFGPQGGKRRLPITKSKREKPISVRGERINKKDRKYRNSQERENRFSAGISKQKKNRKKETPQRLNPEGGKVKLR